MQFQFNFALLAAVIAWALAQSLKVIFFYIQNHEWNWALLLKTGGMPSSHSALVTSLAHGIGLQNGFGSPLYAIAFVLAMVVIYDAAGIRRQAGKHAQIINQIVSELAAGHPLQGQKLREVLGHTPLETLTGMVLGLLVAQILFWLWR